jgi:hypothetical protein
MLKLLHTQPNVGDPELAPGLYGLSFQFQLPKNTPRISTRPLAFESFFPWVHTCRKVLKSPRQVDPSLKALLKNRGNFGREYRVGIFKQSMGARNRVGIRLSYRPASLHRLAEFIPWNRFLGSIKVKKFELYTYGERFST